MKIKLNKKQFKYLLPNRQYLKTIDTIVEYERIYELDELEAGDVVYIRYYPNTLYKIFVILLFIPIVLYNGLGNIKDITYHIMDIFKNKEAYSCDTIANLYGKDSYLKIRFRELVEGKLDNIK